MKKFFNANKKIILILTIALLVVLSGCLVLPQVFASKEEGGELYEAGSFVEETNPKEMVKEQNISTEQNVTETDNAETEKITTNEPVKTITKTISGEKKKFEYVKTEKTDSSTYDDNQIYVYKNDDKTEIEVDSQTGELRNVTFYGLSTDDTEAKITEAEAIQIAKSFAKEYCDISEYSKCQVFPFSSSYMISFSKEICGIGTTDGVVVIVDENANVYSYTKTPDIFKDFDMSELSITEADIIKLFKQEKGDEAKKLEINSITLTVKDKKIQAIVEYRELDDQGNYVNEHAYRETYIALE